MVHVLRQNFSTAMIKRKIFNTGKKDKHLSTKEDGDKIIDKLLEGDTEKSHDSETLFDNANIKNNVGNEATFFH